MSIPVKSKINFLLLHYEKKEIRLCTTKGGGSREVGLAVPSSVVLKEGCLANSQVNLAL